MAQLLSRPIWDHEDLRGRSTWKRLLVALAVGVWCGIFSYVVLKAQGDLGSDFNWIRAAARYWVGGGNPYLNPAFGAGHSYPFTNPVPYPLPAIMLGIPFAIFGPYFSAALFMATSSAILAWCVAPRGWRYWPLFLSTPFITALTMGQWSPLMVAGAFLPIPILVLKPNIGLSVSAYRLHPGAVVGAIALSLLGLALMPTWPHDWLGAIGQHGHEIPAGQLPFGPLLLISILACRRPEGRVFLLLAVVPQTPFLYDALPLWLIPRTSRQAWFLTSASWIVWAVRWREFQSATTPAWLTAVLYLSALAIVLWQEWQFGFEATSLTYRWLRSRRLAVRAAFLKWSDPVLSVRREVSSEHQQGDDD